MSKKSVKLEEVQESLVKNQIDSSKTQAILSDLKELLGKEQPKTERPKKEFVIVISDPEGKIQEDFVGWALQIEEGESPTSVLEKISLSVAQYNQTKKGRKMPIVKFGEAMEGLPNKITKENKVWRKTKEPVLIVKTDNKLIDLSSQLLPNKFGSL